MAVSTDGMEPPHLLEAGPTRGRRSRRWWIAGGVVLVVAAMAAVLALRDDDREVVHTAQPGPSLDDVPAPTFVRDPSTGAEGWKAMSASPLAGRDVAITAWTGKELLVVRGSGAFNDGGGGEPGRTDGAAFDPATDRWRRIADPPFGAKGPIMGADTVSTWTGKELLVWGGDEPRAAAYDPATDRWRDIDVGPLEARDGVASVWTGREWILTGGIAHAAVLSYDDEHADDDDIALTSGAAYDPVSGAWREIAASPTARVDAQAVWDGSSMLVVGGYDPQVHDGPSDPAMALGYDPDADAWRPLAEPPFADVTGAVWTGSEVVAVVLGGSDAEGELQPVPPVVTYEPEQDRWTTVADAPVPVTGQGFTEQASLASWFNPTVVWTGREVLLFGSAHTNPEEVEPLEGFALDVGASAWRKLPASGLVTRGGSSTVWTGTELLLWGGASYTGFTSQPYADGARYRPGAGR